MHVKGLELPGYEPRTLHAMALGLAVNARGADHNRSGAYEADLSGELDRLDGGDAARRGRDRDRGPRGRDGLDDPLQVPPRRVRRTRGRSGPRCWPRSPAGTSTATSCTTPRAGSSLQARVQPPRGLDARGGHAAGAAARRAAHAPLRPRSHAQPRAARRRWSTPTTGHADWTYLFKTRNPARAAMALSVPPKTDAPTVTLHDRRRRGHRPDGTTIYTAAKEAGIEIPVLCHDERYDPVGVCRMCAVDVGGRVLAAACVRPCEDGMEVTTANAEGREAARGPDRAADGRPAATRTRRRRPPGTTCCSSSPGGTRPATPSGCRRRAGAARTTPTR